MIKWDETTWLVSLVPHTSATAQKKLSAVSSRLALNGADCFDASWNYFYAFKECYDFRKHKLA